MKSRTLAQRSLTFLAAGKLAIASHIVCAGGGFGKLDENPVPKLSLYEIGVPADVLVPPYQEGADNATVRRLNDRDTGTIYKQRANNGRIDFLITGVRNDMPVDVFIAFSTRPGNQDSWQPSRAGHLSLDPQSMEIVAGIRAQPTQQFLQQPTSLGTAQIKTTSVTLSVYLSDLNAPQLQGGELFFQAFSVPAGKIDFLESQASEVDRFTLVKE